jgi:hypothetical protein
MDYRDELIARWRSKHDELITINRQLDALGELILAEMQDGEKRGGVLVVAPRRFSPRLAKEVLTAEDFDRICEQKPSAAKAARLLGDDVVELCRESSGTRFLRVSDDG